MGCSSLPSATKVTYIHLYECGDAGHFKFPQDCQLQDSAVTSVGDKCKGQFICIEYLSSINVRNYAFAGLISVYL